MLAMTFFALAAAVDGDPPEKVVPIGSRIARDAPTESHSDAEIRRIVSGYSTCVLRKKPDVSKRFVLSVNLEDGEYSRLAAQVTIPACLTGIGKVPINKLGMTSSVLRYGIADALLRTEGASKSLHAVQNARKIPQWEFDETDFLPKTNQKPTKKHLRELAANREKTLAAIYMDRLGTCVVTGQPGKSADLLAAPQFSAIEDAAFTALVPQLNACVADNKNLVLSKLNVRGTIALNFYRLANVQQMTDGAQK